MLGDWLIGRRCLAAMQAQQRPDDGPTCSSSSCPAPRVGAMFQLRRNLKGPPPLPKAARLSLPSWDVPTACLAEQRSLTAPRKRRRAAFLVHLLSGRLCEQGKPVDVRTGVFEHQGRATPLFLGHLACKAGPGHRRQVTGRSSPLPFCSTPLLLLPSQPPPPWP